VNLNINELYKQYSKKQPGSSLASTTISNFNSTAPQHMFYNGGGGSTTSSSAKHHHNGGGSSATAAGNYRAFSVLAGPDTAALNATLTNGFL
jgi:hypothetical protein